MARWRLQALSPNHRREDFDCGNSLLNDWFRLRATQWQRKGLARCYVATRSDSSLALGFHALSGHHVSYGALPSDLAKGMPRIDVPVILIGRLAVDLRFQGDGLGRHLLMDALARSLRLSHLLGIRAVEVDAIDDRARAFYLQYGFRSLEDDPGHLFLPLSVARKLPLP